MFLREQRLDSILPALLTIPPYDMLEKNTSYFFLNANQFVSIILATRHRANRHCIRQISNHWCMLGKHCERVTFCHAFYKYSWDWYVVKY